jgi:clan AA aspartic protease (TIGR02281 family)
MRQHPTRLSPLVLTLVVASACMSPAPHATLREPGTYRAHWVHGGAPPTQQDGSPWVGSPAIREARLTGDDSQLLVEAKLNGHVSGLFLLDTGASYCVITPDLAKRLGVGMEEGQSPVALLTPGGKIEAPMTTLRSVEVARARAGDVSTVIYPAVDAPLSGILGLSFLKQFEFSVDARRRVLRLRPF